MNARSTRSAPSSRASLSERSLARAKNRNGNVAARSLQRFCAFNEKNEADDDDDDDGAFSVRELALGSRGARPEERYKKQQCVQKKEYVYAIIDVDVA